MQHLFSQNTFLIICSQCQHPVSAEATGILRCAVSHGASSQAYAVTAGLLQPSASGEVTKASLQIEQALKNTALLSEAVGVVLFLKLKNDSFIVVVTGKDEPVLLSILLQ